MKVPWIRSVVEERMSDDPASTREDKEDVPPDETTDPVEQESPGVEMHTGQSNESEPPPDGVPADAGVSPEALVEQKAEAELGQDFDHLRAELGALHDRHLRLVAEFTNYRRRAETELSESWTRGQVDLLRNFLDGLDDLQRVGAWQAESTTVEALVEGVDLVERKFRQALELAGVEVMDPTGVKFDPNIMEAMMSVPTDTPDQDQEVQDVLQKGYRFKGQLVRPARVSVFKHE